MEKCQVLMKISKHKIIEEHYKKDFLSFSIKTPNLDRVTTVFENYVITMVFAIFKMEI